MCGATPPESTGTGARLPDVLRGPSACCVPSVARAQRLAESKRFSAQRQVVRAGSTAEMRRVDGGHFLLGTETDAGFPADGEGPVREVVLDPFYIDTYP